MSHSAYTTPRRNIRDTGKRSSIDSSSPAFQSQHVSKKVRLQPVASQQSSPRNVSTEESDEATQAREDDDSLNEVVIALDMRSRDTVGCCYYVARQEKLYLMSDIKYGGIDIIDTLRLYAQPTIILLSSRIDESVDAHLKPHQYEHSPYVLEIRPSPEFKYETGKRRLIDIRIQAAQGPQMDFVVPGDDDTYGRLGNPLDPGFTGRQADFLRLSASIDLESRLSVGCAGAVLTYLQRRRTVQYRPGDSDAERSFRVTTIEMFALDGIMFLSADTLSSLQILRNDYHPNSHNQGPSNVASGSKEGLSVYGLFHHLAKTPQGRYLLRQYFLRPSLDVDIITERQRTVAMFFQPDNDAILEELVKSLKHIKNMKTVMVHLRKGVSNGISKGGGIKSGVWSSLRSFAFYTLGIRTSFARLMHAELLDIRTKVLERFDVHQLAILGRTVTEIVDFPASVEAHRTVVNISIDEELDEMKRTYDGLEDLLNRACREIADTIPRQYALAINVVFFPQIGFLISMPIDPENGHADYEGGPDGDDAWDRIFSTAESVYFKDSRMRELDETFGDMYAMICDKEIEIIYELAQRVLEFEAVLCEVSDICGEVDSLLALAQGAKKYRLTMPHVTTDNVIQIKGGRHILQELTVPSYIANDAFVSGGTGTDHNELAAEENNSCTTEGHESREKPPVQVDQSYQLGPREAHSQASTSSLPCMVLMTGPNYSGKSIYLKQIALIVYMAHIGSFVPAEEATIGLTDKILTRISTKETVSKVQSAFMMNLQQISSGIKLATRRSLFVIDEFGKGTNPSDGAGLFCGVLEYFLGLGNDTPKVIAATHFHEIFECDLMKSRPQLKFGHMDVRIDRQASSVEDQITYLYTYCPGRSTMSFGIMCAEMNGIDNSVIDRATQLNTLGAQGGDLVLACSKIDEAEAELLREAEEIARDFLAEGLDARQGDPDFPRSFLERLV